MERKARERLLGQINENPIEGNRFTKILRHARRGWRWLRPDALLESVTQRNVRLAIFKEFYQRVSDPPRFKTQGDVTSILDQSGKPIKRREPENTNRAYKLAVTDLVVETALNQLNAKARKYQNYGKRAYLASIVAVLGGMTVSAIQLLIYSFPNKNFNPANPTTQVLNAIPKILENTPADLKPTVLQLIGQTQLSTWVDLLANFTRAFTFYGFVVLLAVTLWRIGRAFLDQAERLNDRRHALRQGRLFVHLTDGELTIEDLEKAFSWNIAQANAFANLNTEAKAPWGAVMSDMFKAMPAAFKAGADAAKSERKSGAKDEYE